MVEDLPEELAGHVVLAALDVDVCQQQPAPLQLLGVLEVPAALGDPLQLVPGPRRLEDDGACQLLQLDLAAVSSYSWTWQRLTCLRSM